MQEDGAQLFRDRHHRHELKTPREVRNALVYILFNDRKHRSSPNAAPTLDPCSSAWWFEDWAPRDRPLKDPSMEAPENPTTKPETWLARWGWHRGNARLLLRFSEPPRAALFAT